jgi:tetratricopeptide (TPR) repeat protein
MTRLAVARRGFRALPWCAWLVGLAAFAPAGWAAVASPPDKAIEARLKAVEQIKDPTERGYAFRELAFTCLDRGQIKEALALADRREETYWFIYIRSAEALARRGPFKEAMAVVDKLEASHWKVSALTDITRACVEAGQNANAQVAADKGYALALAERQPSWGTLAQWGEFYGRIGNKKAAAQAFAAARKALQPEREGKGGEPSPKSVIEFEVAAGMVDEAIANAGNRDSSALARIAVGLVGQGKDDLALKAAIKCQPRDGVRALVGMAEAQAKIGRKAEALETLKQARSWLKMAWEDGSLHRLFADVAVAYARIGELDLADQTLKGAEIDFHSWAELAQYAEAKDKVRARAYLEKAVAAVAAMKKEDERGWYAPELVPALIALGQKDEARAMLRTAIELRVRWAEKQSTAAARDPNAYCLMKIAELQVGLGDRREAEKTYVLALSYAAEKIVRPGEVIQSMAEAGLYDLTLKSANEMQAALRPAGAALTTVPQPEIYGELARIQGRRGLEDEATIWISKLADAKARAFALSGLAAGLKDRAKEQAAAKP